jgi:transcriptional regulator with XRE-family HTH domain
MSIISNHSDDSVIVKTKKKPKISKARSEAHAQFAVNLREALRKRGWTAAELVYQVEKQSHEHPITRSGVSLYLSGQVLPRPDHLLGIAKALKMEPEHLLPSRSAPKILTTPAPPFEVHMLGNGRAFLRVNRECDEKIALEVMKLFQANPVEA